MINEENYTDLIKRMRRKTFRLDREGDYWTQEDREQLTRLFHDGVGLTEITILLQRTEQAINQQIEKMDLYEREDNPSRRRREDREPACLCGKCALKTVCPLYRDAQTCKEGA